EDPRRDPDGGLRARVGPGEPGQPCRLPRDAQARSRPSHRGGGEASARDDELDQAAPDGLRRPRGREGASMKVAREGWPFVAVPGVIALGLMLVGRRRLATPFAAASLASVGFFRDPDRTPPAVPDAVL